MTAKHTLGPWRIWRDMDPKQPRQIIAPSDDFVCVIDEANTNDDANAAFIVQACNSHEALLAACQAAQAALATSENRYLFGAAGVTVGQMLSEAIQTAVERQTSEPCPHCGRNEDGNWFAPCPSDDCPSQDQAAEGER